MKTKMKKLLTLILTVCVMMAFSGVAAFASEDDEDEGLYYAELVFTNADNPDGDVYQYTGNVINPTYTLTLDGKKLTLNKDYTISYYYLSGEDQYSNDKDGKLVTQVKDKGRYDVKVTGIGEYADSELNQRIFVVAKNDIRLATVDYDNYVEYYEYTGQAITPKLTLSKNGKELVNGKDYKFQFQMNTEEGDYVTTDTAKEIGYYEVEIIGSGSYTGKWTSVINRIPMEITQANVTPKVVLSKTSYTYNGKAQKPGVTVYAGSTKLSASDYTVSYASGRKNVGQYKVTVQLKGNYSGSNSATFSINPKGTKISSVKKAKKAFTVKWKKQSGKMSSKRITGYQVRYSLKSSMSGAKTKTIKGYKKTSKKVTGLKSKKKYYVQVRTYTKVGGKTCYSAWSAKKSVKTK